MKEFKSENLGCGIFAATNETHTFGTDALLLADFASPKPSEVVCDLCSGCGIIPLLMLRKPGNQKYVAVEIQKSACELIKKGCELSKSDDRIEIVNADLREMKSELSANSFSLVTVNPPYFTVGSGYKCKTHEQEIIRSEVCCTPDDITLAAARILKSGGRFCLCQRPERLADIIVSMRNAKIEPKRLRFVAKTPNDTPWLFLIEGKLDGKSSLSVEPTLFMNNSDEISRIYGGYAVQEMKESI